MKKKDILATIKSSAVKVLGNDFDEKAFTEKASLRDLGANSMDRAEIIMSAMEEMQIRAPMTNFGAARNIGELCDILSSVVTKQP